MTKSASCLSSCSYIKPQPACSSSFVGFGCLSSCSYIKPQHARCFSALSSSCLSSCSYIKPQLQIYTEDTDTVVYHLVPTSNHNIQKIQKILQKVVYHLVPTSNHNRRYYTEDTDMLFIILFLHQTTTEDTEDIYRYRLFIILFLHQTTTYSCKSTGNQ